MVFGGKKRKTSAASKKKRMQNPWIKHVMAFKKSHPKLKFADVLKQAKKTYKK